MTREDDQGVSTSAKVPGTFRIGQILGALPTKQLAQPWNLPHNSDLYISPAQCCHSLRTI
jgi:hypothetical protein